MHGLLCEVWEATNYKIMHSLFAALGRHSVTYIYNLTSVHAHQAGNSSQSNVCSHQGSVSQNALVTGTRHDADKDVEKRAVLMTFATFFRSLSSYAAYSVSASCSAIAVVSSTAFHSSREEVLATNKQRTQAFTRLSFLAGSTHR